MENLDKHRLQAISVGMQAYAVKIDLLTNATVVQKAIDFVEKNRDYVEQYGQIAQLSFMLPVNSLRIIKSLTITSRNVYPGPKDIYQKFGSYLI